MDRKKELKMQYKQMKPKMGVFIIRSRANNKYFIMSTKDLRGVINGTIVRLCGGIHINKELQNEWDEYGEENFVIGILEELPYDKDESKTDYSEELSLLQMIWEEKLTKEGMETYKKKV